MSHDSAPCKHATDYEIARNLHMTWNDDGICDPCHALLDLFAVKRANADAREHPNESTIVAIENARARHPSTMGPVEDEH